MEDAVSCTHAHAHTPYHSPFLTSQKLCTLKASADGTPDTVFSVVMTSVGPGCTLRWWSWAHEAEADINPFLGWQKLKVRERPSPSNCHLHSMHACSVGPRWKDWTEHNPLVDFSKNSLHSADSDNRRQAKRVKLLHKPHDLLQSCIQADVLIAGRHCTCMRWHLCNR